MIWFMLTAQMLKRNPTSSGSLFKDWTKTNAVLCSACRWQPTTRFSKMFFLSTMEVMFAVMFVCLFVSRIQQKRLSSYGTNPYQGVCGGRGALGTMDDRRSSQKVKLNHKRNEGMCIMTCFHNIWKVLQIPGKIQILRIVLLIWNRAASHYMSISSHVNEVCDVSLREFTWTYPHRGRPAVVALLSALHADLGVTVGRIEPACFLPLLPLLQELEGQPRGTSVHVLWEHECRDRRGDLHLALVPWLFSDNRVPVGVTCPVTLQNRSGSFSSLDCFDLLIVHSDINYEIFTRLSSILIRDSNSSSPSFHLYWPAKLIASAEETSNTSALYFSGSSMIRLSTLPAHEMAFTYKSQRKDRSGKRVSLYWLARTTQAKQRGLSRSKHLWHRIALLTWEQATQTNDITYQNQSESPAQECRSWHTTNMVGGFIYRI